mmetsp:Transcript_708/g.1572  ORF Transcript_708/g.1572 Transcript_708/m.1572 type:complete len:85 (+) Transcript_708:1012-1266(+)
MIENGRGSERRRREKIDSKADLSCFSSSLQKSVLFSIFAASILCGTVLINPMSERKSPLDRKRTSQLLQKLQDASKYCMGEHTV